VSLIHTISNNQKIISYLKSGGVGNRQRGSPTQSLISGFKELMDDYNALM
jgi:hypothetical protein